MKSFILAFAAVLLMASVTFAQEPPVATQGIQVSAQEAMQAHQGFQCPGGQCAVPQPQPSAQAPRWIDNRSGAWPVQGPFRWTGASGRWVLGIRPRFQRQR